MLAPVAIGLAAGTGLAAAAGSAAGALLFGLKPVDPLTLVLAAGGLTTIAVAASAIPAARAAGGVHPMEALRKGGLTCSIGPYIPNAGFRSRKSDGFPVSTN